MTDQKLTEEFYQKAYMETRSSYPRQSRQEIYIEIVEIDKLLQKHHKALEGKSHDWTDKVRESKLLAIKEALEWALDGGFSPSEVIERAHKDWLEHFPQTKDKEWPILWNQGASPYNIAVSR